MATKKSAALVWLVVLTVVFMGMTPALPEAAVAGWEWLAHAVRTIWATVVEASIGGAR